MICFQFFIQRFFKDFSKKSSSSFIKSQWNPLKSSRYWVTTFTKKFPLQKNNLFKVNIRKKVSLQETPNPETLKFLTNQEIYANGSVVFKSIEDTKNSPLASFLISIKGVKSVMFGKDWISVTKESSTSWMNLEKELENGIEDYLSKKKAVFTSTDDAKIENLDSDETIRKIKDIIDLRIRPFVQEDGGDIAFVKYENRILQIQLQVEQVVDSNSENGNQDFQELELILRRKKK